MDKILEVSEIETSSARGKKTKAGAKEGLLRQAIEAREALKIRDESLEEI